MVLRHGARPRSARTLAGSFALLLVAAPGVARAKGSSVALVVEGADARAARDEVAASLGDGFTVVDGAAFTRALAREGQKGALAPVVGNTKKRAAAFDKVRAAGKDVEADEVVLIFTQRTRSGKKTATAYVLATAGGESPELHAAVGAASHPLATTVLEQLNVLRPPEPAPVPESTAPSTAPAALAPVEPAVPALPPEADVRTEELAGRQLHVVGRQWIEASVGMEGGMRHFTYNQGITNNLRDYTLGAAPLVYFGAEAYPMAGLTDRGVFRFVDLGAVFRYARAFAMESVADGNTVLGTTWQTYGFGGRLRARLGTSPKPVVLGVTGGYGDEAFTFDGPSTSYPSVDYHFADVDLDVLVPVGPVGIRAKGGYLFTLSGGDVAARFPHASIGGIEAELGASLQVVRAAEGGLDVRLAVAYRRFFYTMNPVVGDAYVAGGALDQFWALDLGLAYVY